jgi:hypothetical protein
MRKLDRFLSALDGIAESTGLGRIRLDADALIAAALRKAGRPQFRDTAFAGPLRLLLDCYAREADLNLFGRHAAKWDALRCLSNLLRFEAEEEADAGILAERIEKPIFITGQPRSGTTLLHALLAEDPAIRTPRCWQTIFPYPGEGRDTRRQTVEGQLRMFQRLAPEMAALHPLSADAPQECTEITAQVFQSVRYEATHRVPSYWNWLAGTRHLAAYRFHKRFLQHLQHQQRGGRWVLKCPDHIHALGAIETVYPDFRMVFVHRDPLHVIPSASRLTEVMRRPFTRTIDKAEIGRQVAERTLQTTEAMRATADASRPDGVFHVHYTAFAADPLGTVESLYRHFDLELTPQVRANMHSYLAASANGGNRYRLEEFGLDPAHLCAQFESYMTRFDVHREFATWKTSGAGRAPIAA